MPVTLNMVRRRVAAGLTTLLVLAPAHAHFGPIPLSLKGVPTPPVPGLIDGPAPIVVDVEKAIALGKALFWDINVGSDGMACASCHFHAGADSRTRNQLAPGGGRMLAVDAYFDSLPDGNRAAPNHVLRRRDFPLQRTPDPLNPVAPITHESDDTVGSAGTFKAAFEDVAWLGPAADACRHVADPVFHLGARSTRQVVPRNAPTVINAVFNHRNFWDGRANNVFNGSSPWGDRDPHAGVWVDDAGTLVKQRLHLINSSLASQAITPPTNAVEMSCSGRRFADLGRKLMWRRPLEQQFVHPEDSALGAYSMNRGAHPRRGLSTRYYWLVRQAFDSRYWRSTQRGGELGEPVSADGMRPVPYDQFEANFAMFFAIAIQLYESTLVSDDAPFDRSAVDAEGLPVDLSPQALEGLAEFRVAHCSLCHIGPLLTAAAIETNAALARTHPAAFNNQAFAISTTRNVVTRMAVKHDDGAGSTFGAAAIIDTGFSGNGVTRAAWDIGLGAHDPFGNPLSFARQYLGLLAGDPGAVVDAAVREVRPCDFDTPLAFDFPINHPQIFTRIDGVIAQSQDTAGCYNPFGAWLPTPTAAAAELANPTTRKMRDGAHGAFKIPGLRNIELTGPFMHNGSMATLEEVVEFYTRGGNFDTAGKNFGFVFTQSELQSNADKRAAIVAFLGTLTDDRVRFERAPFDHPELLIPHGHGDGSADNPLDANAAGDEWLYVPAVGAGGRTLPLERFEDLLAP